MEIDTFLHQFFNVNMTLDEGITVILQKSDVRKRDI